MQVDVTQFGADPTGAADSAPAINDAIQYCRANAGPVDPSDPYGRLSFPFRLGLAPGRYLINAPINATNLTDQGQPYDLRGFCIFGYGAHLVTGPGFPAGRAMLSLMGSRWLSLYGLTLHGGADPAHMPAIGLMHGQIDPTSPNASGLKFRDVSVLGHFSETAVYNLASESCIYDGVLLQNVENFQYVADGANEWGGFVPYDFVTQRCPLNGSMSFNDNLYLGCSFYPEGSSVQLAAIKNPPINLIWADNHRFISCYAYSPMANGSAGPFAYVNNGIGNDLSGLRCEDGKGFTGFPLGILP